MSPQGLVNQIVAKSILWAWSQPTCLALVPSLGHILSSKCCLPVAISRSVTIVRRQHHKSKWVCAHVDCANLGYAVLVVQRWFDGFNMNAIHNSAHIWHPQFSCHTVKWAVKLYFWWSNHTAICTQVKLAHFHHTSHLVRWVDLHCASVDLGLPATSHYKYTLFGATNDILIQYGR